MATIIQMAKSVQGDSDTEVQMLKDALDAYETAHPGAKAALYRQNNASIRLRVIDQRFAPMNKSRRHGEVWDFLSHQLPEDVLANISLLLTVTPSELNDSFVNFEFERPTPSQL